MLLNLVGNAIKFTDHGEVDISVEGHGETMAIRVRDTGIGIPLSRQSAIFESFVQADGSTWRRFGGTGLGLTISRRLAELMGGSISVFSRKHKGSTFTLEAPLEAGSVTNSQPMEGFSRERPLAGLKALVAEDNAVNQKVATRLLERLGATTRCAGNGREALAMIRRSRFDLVFMDCQMPQMDGFETTKRIRAMERGSGLRRPIIAMTANAMSGDREACLAAGMDGYVSKPINQDRLLATVQRVLGAREAGAERAA